IQTVSCDSTPCPTVQWTEWSLWSSCSPSCGVQGRKFRSRRCYLSSLQPSSQCIGESTGSEPCNTDVACGLPRRTKR
uniref:Uncharacterized protein n=1 Tax=Romanomermis culicivorax TaxID=13658 RepID=A0A915KK02_ROMCU